MEPSQSLLGSLHPTGLGPNLSLSHLIRVVAIAFLYPFCLNPLPGYWANMCNFSYLLSLAIENIVLEIEAEDARTRFESRFLHLMKDHGYIFLSMGWR